MQNYKVIILLAALCALTACKKSSDTSLGTNTCSDEITQSYTQVTSNYSRFSKSTSPASLAQIYVSCVKYKTAIGNGSCLSTRPCWPRFQLPLPV